MTKDSKKVLLSRPKDKSLEAYKAWIDEMFAHLVGEKASEDNSMTEKDWVEAWKEFWSENG